MGLDMYAFSVSPNELADPTSTIELKMKENAKRPEEFFYWRKFNHLHGWMERLYRQRGGEEAFNCISIRLDMGDLAKLEEDTIAGELPHTPGFFFGGAELYPEDIESIQEFLEKAREEIKQGKVVMYDSWW